MRDDVEANRASGSSAARRSALYRFATHLARLASLLTVLVAVPTLGASAAELAWPLELFSHFRVQYALAVLIPAVVLLIMRRYRWATVAVLLLGINAWPVAPFLWPRGEIVFADDGEKLKLVSVNVWSGNRTPDRVIDFLRETAADVIVVLEVTPQWERRLAALAATHPYSAVQSQSGNFGVALYSRTPLDEVEFVPLSDGNRAVAARILFNGQQVHVIGAHPVPPRGQFWSELRNRQLGQLAKFAATQHGPTIVAGDLNITPFSPYFDEFLTAAKLHDPRRGQGLLTTWPADRLLLRIPIDHCLVSDGVTARLATGPDVGSDHLPVIAEIGWPDAAPL